MTVAIGLVCSDGVIVASDSMATTGMTASSQCKVYAEPDLAMVWTAAGSVFVIEEVGAQISSLSSDGSVRTACGEPNLPQIRATFGMHVTNKLRQCYGSALPFGLQQQVNKTHHPFISDFLLLGWSQATPWFLEISNDGQMNWHTKARYPSAWPRGERGRSSRQAFRPSPKTFDGG
jgi:hypothetical protein